MPFPEGSNSIPEMPESGGKAEKFMVVDCSDVMSHFGLWRAKRSGY